MFRREQIFRYRRLGLVVLWSAIGLFFLAFPYNDWFSYTMPRHQTLQLPLSILLGIISGVFLPSLKIENLAIAIAFLLFAMFSIAFWMIPKSVDLTIVYPIINRLMIFHLFIVGLTINLIFKALIVEIKIAFLGMMTAMLFASGLTLSAIQILLCGSFDIKQQHETGIYLLLLGVLLFLFTIGTLIRGLGRKESF